MPETASAKTVSAEPPFGAYSPNGVQRGLLAAFRVPPLNRGALRYRLARMVLERGAGSLDVRFRDGAFRVRNEGHPTEYAILLNPRYNAPEIDFLLNGLPEGGTAIDLGANIGLFSIVLAVKAGPRGRVLAIDASDRFLAHLAFNAAASRLDNVTIAHVAVGDREAMARLVPVSGNPGTATTATDDAGGIPMKPLLTVMDQAGIERAEVLKVDIDGGEEAALVPFFTQAPDARLPARLVVEHALFDGGTRVLEAIENRGFRLTGKTRSNLLYERGQRA